MSRNFTAKLTYAVNAPGEVTTPLHPGAKRMPGAGCRRMIEDDVDLWCYGNTGVIFTQTTNPLSLTHTEWYLKWAAVSDPCNIYILQVSLLKVKGRRNWYGGVTLSPTQGNAKKRGPIYVAESTASMFDMKRITVITLKPSRFGQLLSLKYLDSVDILGIFLRLRKWKF